MPCCGPWGPSPCDWNWAPGGPRACGWGPPPWPIILAPPWSMEYIGCGGRQKELLNKITFIIHLSSLPNKHSAQIKPFFVCLTIWNWSNKQVYEAWPSAFYLSRVGRHGLEDLLMAVLLGVVLKIGLRVGGRHQRSSSSWCSSLKHWWCWSTMIRAWSHYWSWRKKKEKKNQNNKNLGGKALIILLPCTKRRQKFKQKQKKKKSGDFIQARQSKQFRKVKDFTATRKNKYDLPLVLGYFPWLTVDIVYWYIGGGWKIKKV